MSNAPRTMNIREIFHSGLSLLLPEICPSCGRSPAHHPSPICVNCRREIFSSPSCPPASSQDIRIIWSCRPYKGAIRNCLREFKYGGKKKISWILGQLIDSYAAEDRTFPGQADALIPVPLHPVKYMSRGYNQAALIAGMLSEKTLTPVLPRTLLKTRNTAPQMRLAREKRLENLKGSFAVIDKSSLAGKTVLLVDDVMTTGATLETCARELIRAGALCVNAFTLARVL